VEKPGRPGTALFDEAATIGDATPRVPVTLDPGEGNGSCTFPIAEYARIDADYPT
jgi:hypothetical protein